MAKRDDVRRLLDLVVNRGNMAKVAEDMFSRMRESLEEVGLPEDFWTDLRAEMLRLDDVENDLVEIYGRRLSHEAVLWAIAACESPEGKEFFGAMGDIGPEVVAAGVARGERITRVVAARHGLLPD